MSQEMREILGQPGFLSIGRGGQKLRQLYSFHSRSFKSTLLTRFGLACYLGELDSVKKDVQAGSAPDLTSWETAFQFGYATLVVAGAQRAERLDGQPMYHADVLKFLLSSGAPPDVPDIVGSTALHHATMNDNARVDLARILLQNGANVNHQDRYGCVPLLGCFQSNQVEAVELLMEFGADVNIPDADGIVPNNFLLRCGPQVTAAVQKWLRKRSGVEAPMEEKKCDNCGKQPLGKDVKLKMCSACRTTWYCSTQCQRQHWKSHKPNCRPFSQSTTVTLIPTYYEHGTLTPMADFMRNMTGVTSTAPKFTSTAPPKPSLSNKAMVIKVQVPWSLVGGTPVNSPETPLLIYNKKRDFVCSVFRSSNPAAYDQIQDVVRKRGVGGAKGYFPAELENPGKLVVKVDQILAEQPF